MSLQKARNRSQINDVPIAPQVVLKERRPNLRSRQDEFVISPSSEAIKSVRKDTRVSGRRTDPFTQISPGNWMLRGHERRRTWTS